MDKMKEIRKQAELALIDIKEVLVYGLEGEESMPEDIEFLESVQNRLKVILMNACEEE